MDIQVLIGVMVKLLAMLALGYILNKRRMLNADGNKVISSLVVNITCPLLVIASVCNTDSGDRGEILYVLLIGAIIYCILPLFAKLCTKIVGVKNGEKGIYEFMIIFANTSFMGFPVVQSLFGDEAVFYTAILHLPFDILVFSYGVYIILKDSKVDVDKKFDIKEILNPGMVLSCLALIIYLLEIKLPSLCVDTMYTVGNVTTPLSMIVLGSSLANVSIRDMISDIKVFILMFIRLILMPVIIYYLLLSLHVSSFVLGIATITFGMPVASMAVMMSNEYGGNIDLASKSVFLTTIASMITIPFIVKLLF